MPKRFPAADRDFIRHVGDEAVLCRPRIVANLEQFTQRDVPERAHPHIDRGGADPGRGAQHRLCGKHHGYAHDFVNKTLHIPFDLSTVPGMAVLGTAVAVPVVFLVCQASLSGTDSALENSARSVGASPLRVLGRVTVPMLRPALLNSLTQCFMCKHHHLVAVANKGPREDCPHLT